MLRHCCVGMLWSFGQGFTHSPLDSKISLVESKKSKLTKNTCAIRQVASYSLESAVGVQTLQAGRKLNNIKGCYLKKEFLFGMLRMHDHKICTCPAWRSALYCVHSHMYLALPSFNSTSHFRVILFHLHTSNEIMPRNQELEQTMNSQRHQKCMNEKGYGWAWILKRVAVRVLVIMYQSNRSFNIPPRQPPGHLNFWKIFVQIPLLLGLKSCSNVPTCTCLRARSGGLFHWQWRNRT